MPGEIKGNFVNREGRINFNLPIIKFEEDNLFFFYTPALDLTGYGKTEAEAEQSFQQTLGQFLDYSTNNKTLYSELKKLGWIVKGKQVRVPSLKEMLINNQYLTEIFEEKNYSKFDQVVSLPAVA
jgi:hypothetical protein